MTRQFNWLQGVIFSIGLLVLIGGTRDNQDNFLPFEAENEPPSYFHGGEG